GEPSAGPDKRPRPATPSPFGDATIVLDDADIDILAQPNVEPSFHILQHVDLMPRCFLHKKNEKPCQLQQGKLVAGPGFEPGIPHAGLGAGVSHTGNSEK